MLRYSALAGQSLLFLSFNSWGLPVAPLKQRRAKRCTLLSVSLEGFFSTPGHRTAFEFNIRPAQLPLKLLWLWRRQFVPRDFTVAVSSAQLTFLEPILFVIQHEAAQQGKNPWWTPRWGRQNVSVSRYISQIHLKITRRSFPLLAAHFIDVSEKSSKALSIIIFVLFYQLIYAVFIFIW